MNYITYWVVIVNEDGEILKRLFTGSKPAAILYYNRKTKNKQNIAIYEMESRMIDCVGCE